MAENNLQFDAQGNIVIPEQAAPATAPSVPAPQAQQLEAAELTVKEEDEGRGIIADTALQVVGGVRDGVQNIANTAESLGDEAHKAMGGDFHFVKGKILPRWLSIEEAQERDDIWPPYDDPDAVDYMPQLPEVDDADTITGGLTRGVTQFLTGFAVGGAALKGVKVASATGIAVKGAVQGATADFIAFDAHEDRLSNFLRDNVGLQTAFTDYLAADEDDSVMEGKFKNVIEGLGLGVVTAGAARTAMWSYAKVFKRAKRVAIESGEEAAAKVMNDGLEEMAQKGELQLDLFDDVSDPNLSKLKEVNAHNADLDTVTGRNRDAADAIEATGDALGSETTIYNIAKILPPEQHRKIPVDTGAMQSALNYEEALRRGQSMPDPDRYVAGKLFNHDYMEGDADIKDMLNIAADAINPDDMVGTTTFDEIYAGAKDFLADSVDVSPEVIDGSLARMAADATQQKQIVVAGKMLVQDLSREVTGLATRISNNINPDAADEAKLLRLMERLGDVSANLKSVITGSAQTTAAGRIRTHEVLTGDMLNTSDIVEQLQDAVARHGGSSKVKNIARLIKDNGDLGMNPRGLIKIAEGTMQGRTMKVITEYYINSLLSGVKTQVVNAMSNTVNTLLLPTEKMFGGAVGGDVAVLKEGARQFVGLSTSFKDSIKAARIAFANGRNMIDPEAGLLETAGIHRNAITSTSENALQRNFINSLGTVIRLPTRSLLTADEFFKQINYRSDMYAKLMGQADDLVAQGSLQKADVGRFVRERIEASFAKDGSGTSMDALAHAREATFTQPLRKGSAVEGFSNWTNRHPATKLVVPFIRTPMNILKAVTQRTPFVAGLSKSMMADLASDVPSRVAAARGKIVTGGLLWGTAATYAIEGKLTGGGPHDPALRARMMETGWKPYSFVVTGDDGSRKYISYQRMDPFATFFGLAADFTDIAGQVDELTANEIAAAGMVAMSRNVTSKTFLEGITNLTDALSDPQRYGPRLLQNYAGAMVPMSGLMRDLRKLDDPAMRDVRSMMDAVKNQIPGLSETLPAKRSWITGQSIMYPKGWGKDMASPLGEAFAAANPIVQGDWKQDAVLDELADIGYGFTPPPRNIKGVDLNTEQYERLLELHGTIRQGRYTMYERMGNLFESNRYTALSTSDLAGPKDERKAMVQRIINKYREQARHLLMKEYPEIRESLREVERTERSEVRDALNNISNLNN